MTLQELHDETGQLLAAGTPGETVVTTTTSHTSYLETFDPELSTVTTEQGTLFVVLALELSTQLCLAALRASRWTEDTSQF